MRVWGINTERGDHNMYTPLTSHGYTGNKGLTQAEIKARAFMRLQIFSLPQHLFYFVLNCEI